MKCPICRGEGKFFEDRINYDIIWTECGYCNGKGNVSLWAILKYMWFTKDWLLKFKEAQHE